MPFGTRSKSAFAGSSLCSRRRREIVRRNLVIVGTTVLAIATAVAAQDPPASNGTKKRSEEHTSELQSRLHLLCRLLLEKKKDYIEQSSSTSRWDHAGATLKPLLSLPLGDLLLFR